MSFFKDFKEDLSQAVNELLPGEEELKSSIPNQQDLVVIPWSRKLMYSPS